MFGTVNIRLPLKLIATVAACAILVLLLSRIASHSGFSPRQHRPNSKNPGQLLDEATDLLSRNNSATTQPRRRTDRLLQSTASGRKPRFTALVDKGHRLLAKANGLAFQYNWPAAGPVFAEAEDVFAGSNDKRDELYAHVGRLRGLVETLSLPEVDHELTAILKTPIAQTDMELRLLCLISKGDIDFQIDPKSSDVAWQQVLVLAQRSHDAFWENRARGELGTIAFYKGEIWHSLHAVVQSYKEAARLNDSGAMARELTALGQGFAEFGRSKDALRFFEKAIHIAQADTAAEIPFTAYLGKGQILLPSAAGKTLLDAALQDACETHMQVREARVRLVLGGFDQSRGDLKQASLHFQRAAAIASKQQLHRLLASAVSKLAIFYARQDDNQRALTLAKASVGAERQGGDTYDLPQLLVLVAEQQALHGSLQDVHTTYEQAVSLVDELLSNVPTFQDKNILIGTMGVVYKSYFQFAIDRLHNPGEGFRILEQARARGIMDFLRNAASQGRDVAVKSGINDVTSLVHNLLRPIHAQLRLERDPNRREALEWSLWERERLTVLSGEQNQWAGLERAEPVSLADFQVSLQPDEVVLEYSLGRPRSTVLIINRKNIWAYSLADAKTLNELVDGYRGEILSRQPGIQEARALYDALLKPIEGFLPDRLVIIPDGKLQWLPFDALLDSNSHSVLERYTTAYAPSASVEYLLRSAHREQKKHARALFVGDVPYDHAWPEPASSFEIQSARAPVGLFEIGGAPQFVRLPASGDEVVSAAKALGQDSYALVGAQATEAALKSQPLDTYQVLHFATHGVLNTDFPERSALVLGDGPDSPEDGFLQAREIARLPLNAELVTISACNMALGRSDGVAGDTSIIQSFLLAGAKTVVASSWGADDNLTAYLMEQFYEHLAEGADKASALRRAKLDVIHEFGPQAVPFLWAGFEVYGDGPGHLEITPK